jgi:hypothetical protein
VKKKVYTVVAQVGSLEEAKKVVNAVVEAAPRADISTHTGHPGGTLIPYIFTARTKDAWWRLEDRDSDQIHLAFGYFRIPKSEYSQWTATQRVDYLMWRQSQNIHATDDMVVRQALKTSRDQRVEDVNLLGGRSPAVSTTQGA